MTNINQEIVKLTQEWRSLLSSGHHKDRDCHWYIETVWSYGQEPKYYARHYGYILDEISIACVSYEDALNALKNELESAIEKEKESLKNALEDL